MFEDISDRIDELYEYDKWAILDRVEHVKCSGQDQIIELRE